jgi:hypothetical protein
MVAGLAQIPLALAGLTIASVRKRTWKIANRRGESGWVPDQEGCRLFPHQDRRGTYRGRDPAAIVQTMWGTAADRSRCNRVCRCEEDFEDMSDTRTIRRDAPEHILAADCRDDLASAASPPACPFLGCTMWCSLLTLNGFPRCNRCRCTKKRP